MKFKSVPLANMDLDVSQVHVPDPTFRTITFADYHQDFMWFQIDERGVVQECGPFQGWMWRGYRVLNHKKLFAGGPVRLKPQDKDSEETWLKYPILQVLPEDAPLPTAPAPDLAADGGDLLDRLISLLRNEPEDIAEGAPRLELTYPDHAMNLFKSLAIWTAKPGQEVALRDLWGEIASAYPTDPDKTEYLLDWWHDGQAIDGNAGLAHDAVVRIAVALCLPLHHQLPDRRKANGWT